VWTVLANSWTNAKPVRPAIGGGPTYQVDTPGEMLHGPLPETGMGFQYFITAIDDYCCYAMVGLLRHKSDAVSALQDILVRAGNVKLLCSDQGGEYLGSRMAWMPATGEQVSEQPPESAGKNAPRDDPNTGKGSGKHTSTDSSKAEVPGEERSLRRSKRV